LISRGIPISSSARSPSPGAVGLGEAPADEPAVSEARQNVTAPLEVDPHRWVSNLGEVLGPYRQPQDVARYQEGLRRAGLARITDAGIVSSWHKADICWTRKDVGFRG
jgi:hypothetical protein